MRLGLVVAIEPCAVEVSPVEREANVGVRGPAVRGAMDGVRALVAILVLACCTTAPTTSPSTQSQPPSSPTAAASTADERTAGWTSDLDMLIPAMDDIHPDLGHEVAVPDLGPPPKRWSRRFPLPRTTSSWSASCGSWRWSAPPDTTATPARSSGGRARTRPQPAAATVALSRRRLRRRGAAAVRRSRRKAHRYGGRPRDRGRSVGPRPAHPAR